MTRLRLPTVFVLALALAPAALAQKVYLPVPNVSWTQLQPYVRANVVPFVHDGQAEFFICTGVTEPSSVEHFDQRHSDYVKALLLRRMSEDPAFAKRMQDFGDDLRATLKPSQFVKERQDEVRAIFWRRLEATPELMAVLHRDHEELRTKGRMRCRVCEESAKAPAEDAANAPS